MPNPTKIICTLGPATEEADMIGRLIEEGMDAARLNFSHGDHDTHRSLFERVREVAADRGEHIAIIADLQGPKIRVGELKDSAPVMLEAGEQVIIDVDAERGDARRLTTTYHHLAADVEPGDRILINDGMVELRVREIDGGEVVCEVVYGGQVREHAGINLPGVKVSAPSLTEKDREDLEFALELGVDYVALSFVRSAGDVRHIKRAIAEAGANTPVIAKLEKPEALNELAEVVEVSDVVMVARGDLGVETSPGAVPILQKRIIRECARRRVPVITATQMLESMTNSPRPTRAEASDVANAIFDATDAIMLSGETAIGKYPAETVAMMRRIACAAEEELRRSPHPGGHTFIPGEALDVADAVSRAAVETAAHLGAVAVVAFTQSGGTARLASKCRPAMPIIAATPLVETARRCNLFWGVTSIIIEPVDHTDDMIHNIDVTLRKLGMAREGDIIVVTAGTPIGRRGSTNMMRVHVIGE
ncbi:MAG: pyruvate kinase [Armatimonadetes bacterium]|nr:pyruvate kinase [Armatimonadota bacterium]